MAITYTPTTNFGAKDSLPTNDPDKVIKGSEFTTEFTALQTAFSLAAPAASPTFTGTVTIASVDINGGAIDGTVIGGATPAAGSFTSLTATSTDATITLTGTRGTGDTHTIATAGANSQNLNISADDSIFLRTSDTIQRVGIFAGGDISFYEDTGTTPKFFWDASAESLGIGTTSPTADGLHIYNATQPDLFLGNADDADGFRLVYNSTDTVFGNYSNTPLRFITNSSEAMRIDSSGNLLVGTTDNSPVTNNVNGIALKNNGQVQFSYAGTGVAINRKTSDGNIIDFRKDGTPVGSIGTGYGVVDIKGGSAGLLMGNSAVLPVNGSGTLTDGSYDVGASSFRFKDLYLSGGVYLGGTVAANKLDDYEEGTWTPTVTGSSTAGSYSNTSAVGKYVKVGAQVIAWMYFYGQSGTGSGNLTIGGLPFNVNTEAVAPIQYNFGLDLPTGTNTPMFFTNTGTYGFVRCNNDSTSSYVFMPYPTSAGYIRMAFSYFTNS